MGEQKLREEAVGRKPGGRVPFTQGNNTPLNLYIVYTLEDPTRLSLTKHVFRVNFKRHDFLNRSLSRNNCKSYTPLKCHYDRTILVF